jgi:glycosyltransferase involved in cell wall biosynthesis
VIHTTLWEADILGRTAGVLTWTPVVSTLATSENAPSPIANPGVRRWKLLLAHWVDIVTARAVRRFHAVSESVAERMALSLHVPRRRITVIPRARRRDLLGEPSTQRRQSVRTRLGLGDSVPVVLTVARHEHQKGLDVLVAATPTICSSFPDVVVLVAGHCGRMSAALERSVAATGLDATIRILGDRDDVADLLVAADVVAVPSRVEGLPGAVLEAMALERPVVSSDLPTVREAIDDHAYAMVPPGDADALGRAVVRCLRDQARADKARAARQRFDELFSPSSVAARLRELYEDTLTGRFTAMGLRRRWTTVGRR